jgi:hypothetical protein
MARVEPSKPWAGAGVALDAGMLDYTPRGFQFIRAAIAQLVRGFRDRARPGYVLW